MTKYSIETKLKAIKLVKEGYSSYDVADKIHIPHRLIDNWAALYQKYGQQALQVKLKDRVYTGDFKLKVLNWRKQHRESYLTTAVYFGISNNGTVANWQRKLDQGGIEALFTKQGRPPMRPMVKKKKHARKLEPDELSELKKLRLENRALHVENEYLKKLAALVQKRGHRPKKDGSSKN